MKKTFFFIAIPFSIFVALAACQDKSTTAVDQGSEDLTLACGNALPINAVTATDEENGTTAGAAVDGDPTTQWTAAAGQSITLDLGSEQSLCGIGIDWANNDQNANDFNIQVSDDGENFTDVLDATSGPNNSAFAHKVSKGSKKKSSSKKGSKQKKKKKSSHNGSGSGSGSDGSETCDNQGNCIVCDSSGDCLICDNNGNCQDSSTNGSPGTTCDEAGNCVTCDDSGNCQQCDSNGNCTAVGWPDAGFGDDGGVFVDDAGDDGGFVGGGDGGADAGNLVINYDNYQFNGSPQARYVRILVTSTNGCGTFGINEIAVYGDPGNGSGSSSSSGSGSSGGSGSGSGGGSDNGSGSSDGPNGMFPPGSLSAE